MTGIDLNAIIVRADQTPGKASFQNFEELKEYLEKGLSVYQTTEYSADNLDQAEKDLKELRALKKKLSEKKKELEQAYCLPISEVSRQLDELIEMVKAPIDILNKQIKESKLRVKKIEIMNYAKQKSRILGEYADKVVNSPAFYNSKWEYDKWKPKDWKADVDRIIQNAEENIETIRATGGKAKSALLGFYFDKLSLEGADQFVRMVEADVSAPTGSDDSAFTADEGIRGYKILKISGTERQMRQLMIVLEMSELEVEELEDGMPKPMEEHAEADFDSFVAFDIEHTGTNGVAKGDGESEIIEIGAVKVADGKITEQFDMLANPGRKIIPRVARLTHITDEMVKNEPPVGEVIMRFKEFVGDSILVGHNIKSCDIPHIARAAKKAGIHFDNQFYDTVKLARQLREKNNWENVKLSTLAEYYGVEQKEVHRAWCDAKADAAVYMKMRKDI